MDDPSRDSGDERRAGGSQSTDGKCASRGNAIKHGLSAKTLLPEILNRDLVERKYQSLRMEWRPSTPTEEHFVREMARHTAALERVQEFEDAVLRRGARGALSLVFDVGRDEDDPRDAVLAAAGTSDAVERIARYRRPHERAFLRSLIALRETQARSSERKETHPANARFVFSTEAECEKFLLARRVAGDTRCSKCGSPSGHWIASRKVWQCGQCRRQSSLRAGTVMQSSRLTLRTWFQLIETLVRSPGTSTAELMRVVDIQRAGTVRRLARQVREALDSARKSELLAGLNRLFEACSSSG